MEWKQQNLPIGEPDQFKIRNKSSKEEENLLDNKIRSFLTAKDGEIREIIKKEGKLDGIEIQLLAEKFAEESGEKKDEALIRKIIIVELLNKDYEVSSGAIRADIDQKNGSWLEQEAEEIKEKDKKPPLDPKYPRKGREALTWIEKSFPKESD